MPQMFSEDHFLFAKECPLWVKSRHLRCNEACPLYPRKRHQMRRSGMSAKAKSGHQRLYSITSLACASSAGETTMPSVLAVFRLITSSYLVGACTGRSEGFSPLRMRST